MIYFQVQSPYYQAAQCNHKHLFLYSQGDWLGLRKPKKEISINTNHITATSSIHVPKPVPTDLTIKPDSTLTNPIIGKDGVRSWLI